jgi:hypothetical protein
VRIDLFEARAILLGKLGRHDSALELYVYKLRDYDKAERYADHADRHCCGAASDSSPTDIANECFNQGPKLAIYS